MLVVGLTGGIGSGKTLVSDAFARHGIPIIDTDRIAHQLVQPGEPALQTIREAFGDEMISDDGSLDRARLRQRVFDSDTDRARLESILHPLIEAKVKDQIADTNALYCIVVVPLLVETGGYSFIDRILVVDTPQTKQIERAMQRDNIDRKTAEKILRSQASREQRLDRADDIIHNDAEPEQIRPQVDALHRYYMELAATGE